MKKIILVQLFFLALSFCLFAEEMVNIGRQKNIDISQVESSEVWLRVDYTGSISGVCGIKLESSLPISQVFQEVEFDKKAEKIDEFSASFSLTPSRYVDWLILKVASGESLKSVLKRLNMTLLASSVPCKTE